MTIKENFLLFFHKTSKKKRPSFLVLTLLSSVTGCENCGLVQMDVGGTGTVAEDGRIA